MTFNDFILVLIAVLLAFGLGVLCTIGVLLYWQMWTNRKRAVDKQMADQAEAEIVQTALDYYEREGLT